MPRISRALLSSAWLTVIGLGLMVNWLYVPWTYTYQRRGLSPVSSQAGYDFLTSPPPLPGRPYISEGVEIDYGRILLQTAAIAAIGLVGLSLGRFAAQFMPHGQSASAARLTPPPADTPGVLGRILTSTLADGTTGSAPSGYESSSAVGSSNFEEQPSPLTRSSRDVSHSAALEASVSRRIRYPGRPVPIVIFWLYLTFY